MALKIMEKEIALTEDIQIIVVTLSLRHLYQRIPEADLGLLQHPRWSTL